jgi:signal recognition particle subunit SRP54
MIITKALYDAIFNMLEDKSDTTLHTKPLSYHMLVGLQGVGKTTTSAKLAYYMVNKLNKKVLLCSLDFNRPSAYLQLQTLAKENNLDFFEYEKKDLKEILSNIDSYAKRNNFDVVLLDSAGRLSINAQLMEEMQDIYNITKAKEVLFVIDSGVGQSALSVAKAFANAVPITGIIASKVDSDSRGGAILSCKYITNSPIKFMGFGEKIDKLEVFNSKKITDRLLNQGDILTLVEKFGEIEQEDADKLQENLEKGIFTLEDFKKQFVQMNKLGGMSSLMSMIPGLGNMEEKIKNSGFNEGVIKKYIAIIDSMNKKERKYPKILDFSRKKRIAQGSGTTLADINVLLKQYTQMANMMKQFRGKNMLSMMGSLKGLSSMGDMKNIFNKIK